MHLCYCCRWTVQFPRQGMWDHPWKRWRYASNETKSNRRAAQDLSVIELLFQLVHQIPVPPVSTPCRFYFLLSMLPFQPASELLDIPQCLGSEAVPEGPT